MHIEWSALALVTVVSVVASVLFVALLAFGIRFVSAARVVTHQGGRATGALSLGYAFLACAGLLVLYCLYLIVPQLH